MKLYEINEAIARLMEQLTVDEETGELAEDTDGILEQLHALELDRRSVLEYLAKLVLNIRAEKAALKAEEQRLKSRRDALDYKEDQIMRVLDRECAGERTSLGVATFGLGLTLLNFRSV